MSVGLVSIGLVNVITGMIFGVSIGTVPVYMQFNSMNLNCTHFTGPGACHGANFAECNWEGAKGCQFKDNITCPLFASRDECKATPHCVYDYGDKLCKHEVGWDAVQMGVYASSMNAGAMFGSLLVSHALEKLGRRNTLLLLGVVSTLGAILSCIARVANSYPLLVVSRLVIGLTLGGSSVAGPLYVGEMAPPQHKGVLGVLFQIFCTFGIVAAALIGYAARPLQTDTDMRMEMRIQILLLAQVLFSFLLIPVAWRIPSQSEYEKLDVNTPPTENETAPLTPEDGQDEGNWFARNWKSAIAAVVLSAAMQLTGINAIMNYAPQITKAAGMSPLLGNFVVMSWNFVTTLISIPIAHRFSRRGIYLTGLVCVSAACLFTGVPTFPGVTSDKQTKHGLAAFGIAAFILAFEVGMGPMFYILATELFPPQARDKGCSFTNVVQFCFNIFVNLCFPILVVDFSGGPDGDQNKGLAVMFMIFGSIGLVCTAVLFKIMHPYAQS